MKVLIAGASGFIGTRLTAFLQQHETEVFRLVRKKELQSPFESYWDPERGVLETRQLEGVDAVINLSGESIRGLHWSEAKKKRLLASRVAATELLCRTAALCSTRPKRIFSASAVGYYGHRGAEVVDETAPAGRGFMADLCVQWESATNVAKAANIPVVLLRTGIVLSPHGGALQTMLLPFRLGLGGKLGSGSQYMSWIALDDFLHLVLYLLAHPNIAGPVNLTAPNPVTNATFTQILGEVLHRPTFCAVPETVVRWVFGEMGEELLLSSIRVYPQKSMDAGYSFLYPNLLQALQMML